MMGSIATRKKGGKTTFARALADSGADTTIISKSHHTHARIPPGSLDNQRAATTLPGKTVAARGNDNHHNRQVGQSSSRDPRPHRNGLHPRPPNQPERNRSSEEAVPRIPYLSESRTTCRAAIQHPRKLRPFDATARCGGASLGSQQAGWIIVGQMDLCPKREKTCKRVFDCPFFRKNARGKELPASWKAS